MRRIVAVIAISAALAGCGERAPDKPPKVESYAVDTEGTLLFLEVSGWRGEPPHAEKVSEDDATVVVRVTGAEGGGLNVGGHFELPVRLDKPLGTRTVRTDSGETVPAVPS